MADLKISQLTSATTPLAGTETLPVVQSGSTKKVAVSDLTAGRAVSALSVTSNTVGAGSGSALSLQSNGATGATLDASNNFGVNVVPSAWNTSGTVLKGFELGRIGSGLGVNASNGNTNLVANAYYGSGGWTYANNGFAVYTASTANAGAIAWYTAPSGTAGTSISFTQRLGLSNTGDLTNNTGNYIPGTAAKGVDFSANSTLAGKTSTLLNAYEEGTWTPTITRDSVAPTISYTAQVGRYTRVGRLVTISGYISATFSAQGSGNWYLSLPYTIANLTNYTPSGSIGSCGLFSATSVYGVAAQAYCFITNAGALVSGSAANSSIAFTIAVEI